VVGSSRSGDQGRRLAEPDAVDLRRGESLEWTHERRGRRATPRVQLTRRTGDSSGRGPMCATTKPRSGNTDGLK